MKNKMLAIMLSIVMMFAMSAPAYAGTDCLKPVMVSYGDSVGAGMGLPGYDGYDTLFDGDIFKGSYSTIPASFPALVAKRIGGVNEKLSFNACFPGTRPEDYCYILGLKPQDEYYEFREITTPTEKDGVYTATYKTNRRNLIQKVLEAAKNDAVAEEDVNLLTVSKSELYTEGTMTYDYYYTFKDGNEDVYFVDDSQPIIQSFLSFRKGYFEKMRAPETVSRLKKAINKADLITVEQGMNDLSAMALDDMEPLLAVISELMEEMSGEDSAVTRISQLLEEYRTATDLGDRLKIVSKIIKEVEKLGYNLTKTISQIDKLVEKHIDEAEKYLDILLGYMRKLNPNAHIIIANVHDAAGAMDLGDYATIGNVAIKTITAKMNARYQKLADKYGCTIADIGKVKGVSDDVHPDYNGHRQIADAHIKAIEKDCLKRGDSLVAICVATSNCKENKKVCNHENTQTTMVEEATYLTDGFTGKIECVDCGEVLDEGEAIPKLLVPVTSIKKLTSTTNSVVARWAKVEGFDGYEVQISTSKKFAKNVKSLTVKKASKVSKKIGSLKCNKKYYVRVRTIKIVDAANTAYSAWSPNKTIKTK